MNRPADPLLEQAEALSWPARNQAWLAARFEHWCAHLERDEPAAALPNGAALPRDDDGSGDFQPAALQLAALFDLSPFETELLVLAAGMELHRGLQDAVARVQGSAGAGPTRLGYALALALLPHAHWDALSPQAALRYWALLHVDHRDGMVHARLRIDERVLHHLSGIASFDERLVGIAQYEPAPDAVDARTAAFAARAAQALLHLRQPLAMLADAGHDPGRRAIGRAAAAAIFQQLGLRTLSVAASALGFACGGDPRELAEIARRLDREAALTGAGIVLTLPTGGAGAHENALRLIAQLRSPLATLGVFTAQELADLPAREVRRFELPAADATLRRALPQPLHAAAERALQQFQVEPALFEQALAAVEGLHDAAEIDPALWQALREAARGGLDGLAQRVATTTAFDDLVLPPFVIAQLRDIEGQLRHRRRVYDDWGFGAQRSTGLGIAALFAGESGTGKSLAAEAIANEAQLDLYRVDLASVVSKYIGETEKNLARLFDAAERSGAVLLFDEADALFGKRSEVKDSHDRHANVEIAYLLQRIESYRGLAILTTNLRSALDRAFLRRVRFVVQFPFPDEAARERLWRRQFPAAAPLGTVDFGALARLALPGGNIRSIAVNAAFKAAAASARIEHRTLLAAAQAEYAKLERSPLTAAQGERR